MQGLSPTALSSESSLYSQLKCCPAMEPGDAVFYREDVIHRTQAKASTPHSPPFAHASSLQASPSHDPYIRNPQDEIVDRTAILFTIVAADPPETAEPTGDAEWRCADWAAAGECTAEDRFMQCVCPVTCAAFRARLYQRQEKDEP